MMSTPPAWRVETEVGSAPVLLTEPLTERRHAPWAAPVASPGRSTTQGPSGQKVSNPFARPHWPSRAAGSRALTSFAHVTQDHIGNLLARRVACGPSG